MNLQKKNNNSTLIWLFSVTEKCSHSKAHHYYLESLKADTEIPAIKCVSFEEIEDDQCTILERNKRFLMGGDLTKGKDKPTGIFYLETFDSPPFTITDVDQFRNIKIIDHTEATL